MEVVWYLYGWLLLGGVEQFLQIVSQRVAQPLLAHQVEPAEDVRVLLIKADGLFQRS